MIENPVTGEQVVLPPGIPHARWSPSADEDLQPRFAAVEATA